MVCQFALQFFRCPRCAKTFFFDNRWYFLSENCLHCGLPKWQEADYASPSPDAYQNLSIHEMASDVSVSSRERDSKFLLLVLRDDPGAIHLTLDSEGWADVGNLITRANRYGFKLTSESLVEAAASSPGRGFEWDQPGHRIRAARS